MLVKNSSFKILRFKLSFSIILMFYGFCLSAQNDTIPAFYKDSTGKLFIATGTHVYLYVGTSPDGSKSYRLKGDNGNEPIHWNGHGLKHLTHLNLYLGRRVNLDLFADAIPPKTSIGFESSRDVQKDNITYISGQGVIELSSKDPDAGLKEIYYSLNGSGSTRYTEPIKLEGEGEYQLSVYALDNVGNKEEDITRTIYVDNTPPLSRLNIEGDKFGNIVSGRASLVLSSTDALGVKQTLYSIDSSKMTPYSKPIRTSTIREGEHTIRWYSLDAIENVEAIKSFTFFVDKTPPMVFEEINGNTYMVAGKEFSSGRSQLKIAAVDNKAGVREIDYSLNSGDFKVYEKPVYLSDMLGVASVKSFAVDNVNNRSQSDSQTESFTMPTVDITGPQIFYSFSGPKIELRDTTWIGPKTKIAITAKDIGAGVSKTTYKVKGGEEKVYTEPFSFDKLGFQEVICSAFDNVDNVNFISFGVGVDNQAPSIYYRFSVEPSGWKNENGEKIPIYSKGLKIYLAATDNLSGIGGLNYSLNSSRETVYSSPIERFKSGETYNLLIKTSDVLGNASEKSIKFRVE